MSGQVQKRKNSKSGVIRAAFAREKNPDSVSCHKILEAANADYKALGGGKDEITIGLVWNVLHKLRAEHGKPLTQGQLSKYRFDISKESKNGQAPRVVGKLSAEDIKAIEAAATKKIQNEADKLQEEEAKYGSEEFKAIVGVVTKFGGVQEAISALEDFEWLDEEFNWQ